MSGKRKKPPGYAKAQARKEFEHFVKHPRYGRFPNITGLHHDDDLGLHWRSRPETRIPDTVVVADLSRQTPALFQVTHYYDEKRICRDCDRPFIFFALEQKHWYEQLGFPLDSDCVRCTGCRKKTQAIKRLKERYDSLYHRKNRTPDETLEMADCCLTLIEEGVFTVKQIQTVSMLMNNSEKQRHTERYKELTERLATVQRMRD